MHSNTSSIIDTDTTRTHTSSLDDGESDSDGPFLHDPRHQQPYLLNNSSHTNSNNIHHRQSQHELYPSDHGIERLSSFPREADIGGMDPDAIYTIHTPATPIADGEYGDEGDEGDDGEDDDDLGPMVASFYVDAEESAGLDFIEEADRLLSGDGLENATVKELQEVSHLNFAPIHCHAII
jgi:hypothetical protein